MNSPRQAPQDEDGTTSPTTGPRAQTAFQRLLRIYPDKAPENASAAAFVRWIVKQGWTGEHLQQDLYREYAMICQAAGYRAIRHKHFGKALTEAGYQPFQTDRKDNHGKRVRENAVNLSKMSWVTAASATNVRRISTSATSAKPQITSANPRRMAA
jgi:hypothetical protein